MTCLQQQSHLLQANHPSQTSKWNTIESISFFNSYITIGKILIVIIDEFSTYLQPVWTIQGPDFAVFVGGTFLEPWIIYFSQLQELFSWRIQPFSKKETIEKLPLVNSGSSQANLLDLTTLIVKVPAASNWSCSAWKRKFVLQKIKNNPLNYDIKNHIKL